jgi:hypothetical protein
VPLPAGRWRARIEPAPTSVGATITVTPAAVELQAPASVRFEVAAKPGALLPARATTVVLERER